MVSASGARVHEPGLLSEQGRKQNHDAIDDGVGSGFKTGDRRVALREIFEVGGETGPTGEAVFASQKKLRIGKPAGARALLTRPLPAQRDAIGHGLQLVGGSVYLPVAVERLHPLSSPLANDSGIARATSALQFPGKLLVM